MKLAPIELTENPLFLFKCILNFTVKTAKVGIFIFEVLEGVRRWFRKLVREKVFKN
jgi:hypothetical protein